LRQSTSGLSSCASCSRRPHKAAGEGDLDKDYPIRLQKLVDAPDSPYADGFNGLKQHTRGPFAQIRGKVQELAPRSGVPGPGTPDNYSDESERRGRNNLAPWHNQIHLAVILAP